MRKWVRAGSAGAAGPRRATLRRSAMLVPAVTLALAVPQQCTVVEEPGSEGGASAPPSGAATAPLADVDPCLLLDETTAPRVGIQDVASGEPSTTNSYRQCGWSVAAADPEQSYGVVVGVSDTLSIERIRADFPATPVTVGSREAFQVEAAAGDYCSVYIGVGDTSLVVTDVAGGGEVDKCGLALQVAQLVEPGLPG